MRSKLQELCKIIKRNTGIKFDCRSSTEKLRRFVAEHNENYTTSTTYLDSLQVYCKEETSSPRLKDNYDKIYSLAKEVQFPNIEGDLTSTRSFYTELQFLGENSLLYELFETILSKREFVSYGKNMIEELRLSFPLASYLLATANFEWRTLLIRKDDMLLDYLPFSLDELSELWILSDRLAIRYFGDPDTDPSAAGDRAIREAAKRGRKEAVRLLLADPRTNPAVNRNEPVREAAARGYTEILRLLLYDVRVNHIGELNEAFIQAAAYGHVENVRLLLEDSRIYPDARSGMPLLKAAENGHTEVVSILLSDPRVDAYGHNNSPIKAAASNGHADVVKLLLERTCPPDIDQPARAGHTTVVAVLLADGRADPSENDNSALKWSAEEGHTAIVKLLLADPRVDPAADAGYALRKASELAHSDIVQVLGADPRVARLLCDTTRE